MASLGPNELTRTGLQRCDFIDTPIAMQVELKDRDVAYTCVKNLHAYHERSDDDSQQTVQNRHGS